jgi:hypothetical protein
LDWDINTHQNPNSQKKQWPVGMGHDEHESQLNKEHTSLPPHHYKLVTTLYCYPPKDKAVKTKTPSSPLASSYAIITACAVVADDVSHRVARC